MPGSFLAQRVRRMLESRIAPRISRKRLICAVFACAIAAAVFAACTLDRTHGLAPGQPTMNDLMHRRVAEWRAQEEAQKKFIESEARLTPQEIQALEARVAADPRDDEDRERLLAHYQQKGDWKSRDRHILWVLEYEPEKNLLVWPNVDPNPAPENWARAKSIVLAQIKKPAPKREAFERAAAFMAHCGDLDREEQVLLDAAKAYPDPKRWAVWLSRLYAGSLDQQSPLGDRVRAKLAGSTDAYLLAETAQYLLIRGSRQVSQALAGSYVDRALSLQPDLRVARVVKQRASLVEEQFYLNHLSADQLAHADSGLRMRLLNQQVQEANLTGNFDEPGARELLELARRNPKAASYGDAIYNANIALGRSALRRGDRRTSAKYLLAAAETPGSERMRCLEPYGVTMALPRSLIDWGEREAVAQFLERAARLSEKGPQFKQWAAEIRRGLNPDLIPYNAASML